MTKQLVHITQGSGKLTGIKSINTSTVNNEFCKAMAKSSDSICSKCYANRYEKMRPALANKLDYNSRLLSENILHWDILPVFIDRFIRVDSFGELINTTHFKNILNIALKNPEVIITLWTKRIGLVQTVLKNREKPDNLILIYSSSIIGKQAKLPQNFDKVFTVYPKTVKNQDYINCSGKSCISCQLCYTKNDVKFINEIQK